jgi:hypothetical protein
MGDRLLIPHEYSSLLGCYTVLVLNSYFGSYNVQDVTGNTFVSTYRKYLFNTLISDTFNTAVSASALLKKTHV